jgi:ferrous iron transport protein B
MRVMTLLDLQNSEKGIILKVRGRGAFRRRIIEMGFVTGKTVEVIKKAPLQDPIEYSIMGYNVSLRSSEAQLIEVAPVDDQHKHPAIPFDGTFFSERAEAGLQRLEKVINVALVGNPNSGKTTFFNHASGSRERVGNYSGVTVEAKEARFFHEGYKINITDLPGTYSISAYTPEELFVQKYISENIPDVVINVVDASSLERNLYLTTQLIDMDIRVIMVLNMYDELEKKGDTFDHETLGNMLGIPIIPSVSSKSIGIRETFSKVIEVYEGRNKTVRHIHINYGTFVEQSIHAIQDVINREGNQHLTDLISSRFLAIRLLDNDKESIKKIMTNCHNHEEILFIARQEARKLEKEFNETPETIATDLKYGFIAGALKETYKHAPSTRVRKSQTIDNLLTHRLLGFPIFLFFMWLMFTATFKLGSYPMEWIETAIEALSVYLGELIRPGPFKDLLINGIVGGVGGVIVFLPNIMLLFFFISLMEDSGYMSRAVFIMDKLMHKIGLHGKSFIPLLMGFGCNVPAIMATRTLANRNDRMLTMLINPFMSCSARLPIYVLFISAFFPGNQGTLLFLIYGIGVAVAIVIAILFKRTLFRSEEVPFVMELPPYRIPTTKSITLHMWSKAVQYLRKISGVILVASIIIWALGYFPHGAKATALKETKMQAVEQTYQSKLLMTDPADTVALSALKKEKEHHMHDLEYSALVERQQDSYIGQIGNAIQPLMAPLGFDWKMTISIISGVAAKEIVVSTLGVLYHIDENIQTQTPSLIEKLQNQTHPSGPNKGQPVFTPLVALSFMLFVLLYFPCVGVIAAISRESGHWKWGLFTMVYTTVVAWVISFLVYQIGILFLN